MLVESSGVIKAALRGCVWDFHLGLKKFVLGEHKWFLLLFSQTICRPSLKCEV